MTDGIQPNPVVPSDGSACWKSNHRNHIQFDSKCGFSSMERSIKGKQVWRVRNLRLPSTQVVHIDPSGSHCGELMMFVARKCEEEMLCKVVRMEQITELYPCREEVLVTWLITWGFGGLIPFNNTDQVQIIIDPRGAWNFTIPAVAGMGKVRTFPPAHSTTLSTHYPAMQGRC